MQSSSRNIPGALLAVALLLSPAIVLAQATHPDFSGTWILDASRSGSDGAVAAPTSGTYAIVQHGDTITADERSVSDAGELNMKKLWAVDGKVWKNTMTFQATEMPLSSVLSWKDQSLYVQTSTDFQGTPVEQNETWTLGPDGKTLTIRIVTSVNGDAYGSMTLVFGRK